MDAFNPTPPAWTKKALHAIQFCCPNCRTAPNRAQQAWINRQAPVLTENYQRKWQEFYYCECDTVWWAWSSDRPPSDLAKKQNLPPSEF